MENEPKASLIMELDMIKGDRVEKTREFGVCNLQDGNSYIIEIEGSFDNIRVVFNNNFYNNHARTYSAEEIPLDVRATFFTKANSVALSQKMYNGNLNLISIKITPKDWKIKNVLSIADNKFRVSRDWLNAIDAIDAIKILWNELLSDRATFKIYEIDYKN